MLILNVMKWADSNEGKMLLWMIGILSLWFAPALFSIIVVFYIFINFLSAFANARPTKRST